jgi:hypothetical protein
MELTQQQLKEVLHYDPETGIFRWRFSVANRIKPWDVAGYNQGNGYLRVSLKSQKYYLHRLVWLYMTGNWPIDEIDHIDGVRSNNAFLNLREVTSKQNKENQSLAKNSTSGYRGVCWLKRDKRWLAHIERNGKKIYAEYFLVKEDAIQAVIAKRAELFTHDHGRDQKSELVKPSAPCKN